MSTRMRFAVWVLALCAIPAPAAAETVAWRSWDVGFKEAAASRRFVMVDVYADWCGWCKKMDREVFSRPDVREYLQRSFVAIRLDGESNDPATLNGKHASERAIAAHFKVTGYPTTIFLRGNGEHLANVPGYLPADRFLLLLRYIGEGKMDEGVKWEEWVRQSGGAR